MTRSAAAIGSALFFLVAPGTVVGLVPWWVSHWQMRPAALPLRMLGVVLLCSGVAVLIESFVRFAVRGFGTPAPVAPTRHLVVSGLYRYVRNPMYVAVVAAIAGQGLLLGDNGLVIYAACVWLACYVFVVLYEEPKLRATFGEEYERYRDAVPRWIPFLK